MTLLKVYELDYDHDFTIHYIQKSKNIRRDNMRSRKWKHQKIPKLMVKKKKVAQFQKSQRQDPSGLKNYFLEAETPEKK